ncbi:hypothetical protein [Actinomadura sp. K4S16]|uniref:hypothetical protein n=1 Tax=Actinomadura sp. K4S16 TaxID=1316147 RepID=UPI0011F07029|nr:hypothetical protein [Actinomadura sp. K4S16]
MAARGGARPRPARGDERRRRRAPGGARTAPPPGTTQRRAYDLLADGFGPGINGPLPSAPAASPPRSAPLTDAAFGVMLDLMIRWSEDPSLDLPEALDESLALAPIDPGAP